jgi:hypothetical protein
MCVEAGTALWYIINPNLSSQEYLPNDNNDHGLE